MLQTHTPSSANKGATRETKSECEEITMTPVNGIREAVPTHSLAKPQDETSHDDENPTWEEVCDAAAKFECTTKTNDDEKPTWEEVCDAAAKSGSTTKTNGDEKSTWGGACDAPASTGIMSALAVLEIVEDESASASQKKHSDGYYASTATFSDATAQVEARLDSFEASLEAKLEKQFSQQSRAISSVAEVTNGRLSELEKMVQRIERMLRESDMTEQRRPAA